jgi:hypothetical protein
VTDAEIAAALTLAEEGYGRSEYRATHPLDPDTEDLGHLYSEDGYCQACGNGFWKYHMPDCEIAELCEAVRDLGADLQWARSFIKESTGQTMDDLRATEARITEVFGPSDGEALQG